MSIIKKTLDAYALSSNKVWGHDRLNTVGASEVGQCVRKVFWLKNEHDSQLKAERDEGYTDSWGARARGTIFEDHFWEPALRARFGDRLKFAGAEQRTFLDGFLSATPDAVVINLTPEEQAEIGIKTDCANFECKTSDPRTNLTQAKSPNIFQVHVQMGMVREGTDYRPTHAILSYADASFWSDVKEFVIPFDPVVYDIAKDRAMTIMTAGSATELKPEGWIAGGSECNYCPFTKACGIERRNLPFQDIAPVDPQFAAEITDMARDLRMLERGRDGLDAEYRELQDAIKHRLRERGIRKIPGVLTWSPVAGRKGHDSKAVKQAAIEAGVDVSQYETTSEPSDRLVIQIGDEPPIPGAGSPAA